MLRVIAALFAGLLLCAQTPMLPGFPPGTFQNRAALDAGSGVCSEATTFLARTSGLNGTHTSAYTTMICGLVTDGVWSKLDILFIFATQDATTAQLNIPNATWSATATSTPTFTADLGYTGNGTSSYIATNYNPGAGGTNFGQDSAHMSAWVIAAPGGIGDNSQSISNGNNVQLYPDFATGQYLRVNDGSGNITTGLGPTGWYLGSRTGSTAKTLYKNGASIGTQTDASSALVNANFSILAAAGAAPFSTYTVSVASAGPQLSGTEAGNLYTRVCTFMVAVGATGSC